MLITSARFNFSCKRGIFNDDTAQSTNEYPLLVGLIADCAAISDAEAARVTAEDVRETEIEKLSGMTVTVTTLDAGADATAALTEDVTDGHKILSLGLPRGINGTGDMHKSTYDSNDDGIVDNAEKLDDHPASYFAAADHNHDGVYATPMQPQTVELTVAGWVENTQTVNVEGVTDENIIVVSPAPASLETYAAAGVYCSAQGAGTLTFACSAVPDAAVSVNVLVNMVGGGGGGVAVEVDPTVPLWAKAVAAPAYTAEDVGAVDADDEMSNLELLQLWNA